MSITDCLPDAWAIRYSGWSGRCLSAISNLRQKPEPELETAKPRMRARSRVRDQGQGLGMRQGPRTGQENRNQEQGREVGLSSQA